MSLLAPLQVKQQELLRKTKKGDIYICLPLLKFVVIRFNYLLISNEGAIKAGVAMDKPA